MNNQEYQELMEEVNYYQQLLEQVERSLSNLKKAKEDLLEFKEEKSKEILASITGGVYVEAELKGKDLFVNVGSGVVVKKSVDEAIEIILRQEEEVLLDQKKLIEKIEICYVSMQQRR